MTRHGPGSLCTCGCCEAAVEPPAHVNRPGLPELRYRIGTHASLLERMKALIHRWKVPYGANEGARPLKDLATRAQDDPAMALMDAWAAVGDVLTFYQERIVNEGFLGTATERRSILELARAIGYELNPGVAAEAHVAFTVDDADGSPATAPVPAGTQILSIPASKDERPQTFETANELIAHRAWNAMRPVLAHAQQLTLASQRVYLQGAATNVNRGDVLLLVLDDPPTRRRAVEVVPDARGQHTRIDFEAAAQDPPVEDVFDDPAPLVPVATQLELTRNNVRSEVFERTWRERDLQTLLTQHEWEADDVLAYVADLRAEELRGAGEIHAFREKVAFFGHNAPAYDSLSDPLPDAFPNPWDPDWEIWKDSLEDADDDGYYEDAHVYLEREVAGLVEGTWACFETKGTSASYRIQRVLPASIAGFAMSAKVTGLELTDADEQDPTRHSDFKVRTTTAYVRSERLALAALPASEPLEAGDDGITLGEMVLGLRPRQAVLLEGQQREAAGQVRREILTLDEVTHSRGHTRLKLAAGLAYDYVRESVTLNANVVLANHGETVPAEVVGSGDGSLPHQRFTLRKPPLTFVGADTPTGSRSTLTVRVDGVEWRQERSLYGLGATDRSYTVRIDDDAVPTIIFGNGRSGARLPTGQENVRATYRSGIGTAGEVGAGTLKLLKTRPFGIRGVSNPLPASGADDPEKLDDARTNAPLTVLTLDRIVSLRDYEDYARAFSGIGKAQAVTVWNGEEELVHLTVADANGDEVAPTLRARLAASMDAARDPLRKVELDSFRPFVFFVEAGVLIDANRVWDDVRMAIESALHAAFSFAKRDFGQPVTAAEVLRIMHGIAGVRAIDVDALYRTSSPEVPASGTFNAVLDSHVARWDDTVEDVLPAELLLIHPLGVRLVEMRP